MLPMPSQWRSATPIISPAPGAFPDFRFPHRPRSAYVPAMIAHLKGRLAATGADHAVIDVNGVGYLVGASARTLAALGITGDHVTVYTEMLVSEDSIRL